MMYAQANLSHPAADPLSDTSAVRKAAETITSLDAFLASVEKRAWSIARLSTQDDDAAFDIVQDVMLRMFEHYSNKPPAEWQRLFFRVLNNRITDHHRKRGWKRLHQWFGHESDDSNANVPEAVDQLPSTLASPETDIDSQSLGVQLQNALNQLPIRQRQVFLYRQWLGMSVSETAFAMQISDGSVKTHLSRAMSALRDHLEALKP